MKHIRLLVLTIFMIVSPQKIEAMETAVLCIPMAVSGVLLAKEWLSNKQINAVHHDVKRLDKKTDEIKLGLAELSGKVVNVHSDLTSYSQKHSAQLSQLSQDVRAYYRQQRTDHRRMMNSMRILRKTIRNQQRQSQQRIVRLESKIDEMKRDIQEIRDFVRRLDGGHQEPHQSASAPASPTTTCRSESSSSWRFSFLGLTGKPS